MPWGGFDRIVTQRNRTLGTSVTADPFHHHPGLRDKIVAPESSFYRTLTTDTIKQMLAQHDVDPIALTSDADRNASHRANLETYAGGDLWVFGYGSLMWDPAFIFAEVRRARIDGYARRMILKDKLGARGTEDSQGLMAALDHGPHCEGLVFRIEAARVAQETKILWQRECVAPGYVPSTLTARIGAQDLPVLAFVADHEADSIEADMPRAEQLRLLTASVGFMGSSLEYLQGIAKKLRELEIEDDALFSLLAQAEGRVAAP